MNNLSVHLKNYLKLRRGLGFQLRCPAILLRSFVRFAEAKRVPFITTKLALRWAGLPPNIKTVQRASRLAVVRRFAEYVSTVDPRTEVPPPKLLPCRIRRRPPHLYSKEEVLKLMEASRQIDPTDPIKGIAHATLFGLLAVTGMRVGEALSLNRGDIDLKQGLVIIRRAKGNKSRLVPLHLSTRQALQCYADLRDRCFPRPVSPSFFVSERGTRLLHCTVHRWFMLVACQIGLRKPGDRLGPRVHDLRHHFAIQMMLQWYRTNTDVEVRLPELSTYLGHVHVRDTYWYLSAVPELLQLATLRLQPKEAGR